MVQFLLHKLLDARFNPSDLAYFFEDKVPKTALV